MTGFLDRRPFDPADPDGQALLKALVTVYNQVDEVRDFVRAAGLGLADFSWTQPMSHVWREILRQAADRGLLRRLVTVVAKHGGAGGYDVITRLAAEATVQEAPAVVSVSGPPAAREGQPSGDVGTAEPAGLPAGDVPGPCGRDVAPAPAVPVPGPDLDGLSDERVQLLRRSVVVFEEMVSVSVAIADATPFSPGYGKLPARMQRSLEKTRRQVAALQEGVTVAGGWPDGNWVLDFRPDLERAQRRIDSLNLGLDRTTVSGASAATAQETRVRQSAERLLYLLKEKYPSLFARRSESLCPQRIPAPRPAASYSSSAP